MDMPANLRSLSPEAIDILRYYGTQKRKSALSDDIVEGAGLSERGFGKAIRRLVTTGFLTSDGGAVYRLTDLGQRAVQSVLAAGDTAPSAREARPRVTIRAANRRLIVGVPRMLLRAQPTNVYVGFDEASDDDVLKDPVNLLIRMSLINADAASGRDMTLLLGNRHAHQTFEIMPGDAEAARVRVEVLQLSDFTGEYEDCGGIYVDLLIAPDPAGHDGTLVVFGGDVQIQGETVEL
ncbi:MAG: hypothetical protein SGI73_18840 [Chloroflexota bacterium]|nr:hypothetical protein [Chloroflexota bacterium]